MDQIPIPFALYRGGTSKCAVFHADDIPSDPVECNDILLEMFGSPHGRQIDGIGGGSSTTSKAAFVKKSDRPDSDVDFTFAQIGVDHPVVDWSGTCGNCTAAVAAFAVDEGMVSGGGSATVRIFQSNTSSRVIAEVPVSGGKAAVLGNEVIAGVQRPGASIALWFTDPIGAVTGSWFPTGRPLDELTLASGRPVRFSLADAVNPVVFVSSSDLLSGYVRSYEELIANQQLISALECVRTRAAERAGLGHFADEDSPVSSSIPKIVLLVSSDSCMFGDLSGSRLDESADLIGLALSMSRPHPAFPLSGAACTAITALNKNTVVGHELTESFEGGNLSILHPSGTLTTHVEAKYSDAGWTVQRAGGTRTARRLMDGAAYIRSHSGSTAS